MKLRNVLAFLALFGIVFFLVFSWALRWDVKRAKSVNVSVAATAQPMIQLAQTLVQCGKLEYLPKSSTFDANDKALQGCLFVGRTIIIQKDGTIWVEAR